ncbi:hypothetical protein ILFOPFJJ_05796 [Ensifer psoraleae]|nr:hypothetical protein [Sinorhizobium psoraleae]
MLALEMSPLAREMSPALPVDCPGDSIGEMAAVFRGIIVRRDTDGLDPDHPAASEPRQDGVDLAREFVALDVGGAFGIRPSKIPAGHQASVLQQEDAIAD